MKKDYIIILIFGLITFVFVVSELSMNSEKTKLILDAHAEENLYFGDKLQKQLISDKWVLPGHVLNGQYNEYQYYWTDYTWNKYHSKELLYLFASENGLFNHDRKSINPEEESYGFCQINRYWHSDIVNDTRFWNNPGWQIEKCYELWKGGTVFYGLERFKKAENVNSPDHQFYLDRVALFNF